MTLKLITGPAATLQCGACMVEGIGGSEQFTSAASGEIREPEKWYTDPISLIAYCTSCAAKIAEAEDPTRSVTQFYSNTSGEKIESEHLT